ncbi:hypothetical protein JKF63_03703 [Porcisia hertigi]|uniref:Uncharacterized protein n=1 Tax=Porcisia hertigi TaxID=2761500 RepID=A0A836HIP7_9TRYP|nr:hypothetical protein JKF63_03703 [Porcisia hertigi]
MFTRSCLLRVTTTSSKTTTKEIAKRPTTALPVPTVSPAVVRSLYRSLYREVNRLDKEPVLKILFPCNSELQSVLGASGPLHVPGCQRYTDVLRDIFRDPKRVPKINLAFDTLNRLRAHYENVKDKLPAMDRDRTRLLASLRSSAVAERRKGFFRAQPITPTMGAGPKYVQAAPGVPTRVVLREARHSFDLSEGTLLLAHPLSSAHVDRRVMLITECTPIMTSAVVLDLQFTYPLSRGNSMFPEVFWGHDVYDGGFSQIGFTMPPTAQIAVLHTLESNETIAKASVPSMGSSSVMNWLKWKDAPSTTCGTGNGPTTPALAQNCSAEASRKHGLFCRPLICGGILDDGAREPTLYLSKAEALPYLAKLAEGQPRSSLRVYWGNMRWPTSQLEAEVANGHWMAVKTSSSFFRAYALSVTNDDATERFPTAAQLAEAKQLREKRYGADITHPQVFPPDQIMRRRECLWDEIMFALGGEYAALVGCANPFSDSPRWSSLQILAPHMSPLPLSAEEDDTVVAAAGGVAAGADAAMSSEVVLDEDADDDDDDDHNGEDELGETFFETGATDILEHKLGDTEPPRGADEDTALPASLPAQKGAGNPKDDDGSSTS